MRTFLLLAVPLSACTATVHDSVDEPLTEEVFAVPLEEPERFFQTTGVDHDPEDHDTPLGSAICTNYDGRGFPWCYDGHRGTDYLLEGGFEAMDAGSTQILAAADGVVVETDDGNYDRCHVEGTDVVCDGYPKEANYVIVEHPSGIRSMYWHMKTDSVAVSVGDEVTCGDVLGLIGSSGNSSMPHLHFQVETTLGDHFDPYGGEFSQADSWWTDQGDDNEDLPVGGCP